MKGSYEVLSVWILFQNASRHSCFRFFQMTQGWSVTSATGQWTRKSPFTAGYWPIMFGYHWLDPVTTKKSIQCGILTNYDWSSQTLHLRHSSQSTLPVQTPHSGSPRSCLQHIQHCQTGWLSRLTRFCRTNRQDRSSCSCHTDTAEEWWTQGDITVREATQSGQKWTQDGKLPKWQPVARIASPEPDS